MQKVLSEPSAINRSYYKDEEAGYNSPGQTKRYKKLSITKAQSRGIKRFKTVMLIAFFVLLIMGVLYSNAELTEQYGEIEKLEDELTMLESEYAYLSFDMESRTSLQAVEEYAIRELGLIKNDSSKIEYIHLNSENELQVKEETAGEWENIISQNFLSIVEYLKP